MGYSYVLGRVLAQGSAPYAPVGTFSVLALTAREYQPPAACFPAMLVEHVPLPDDLEGLLPGEWEDALRLSGRLVRHLRSGRTVLTTCWQGRNRSGLVNALVLMRLGFDADDAIERIRTARRNALANPAFVDALRDFGRRPLRA